jgi:hypothetical protein
MAAATMSMSTGVQSLRESNLGLLDKTNPLATRESVIRQAWILGIVGTVVGLAFGLWKQPDFSGWPILVPLAGMVGAALGALMEWQMDDGLELCYVIHEVNEEFGIAIPEGDDFETLGDLYQATLIQLRERDDVVVDDDVWRRLKALLVKQLALKPEQVVPEARFYIDLPM